MSEQEVVLDTELPVTVKSLKLDFLALGLRRGMVVLAHSSLSRLGWVCGGAVAVIEALLEVLGETGTLMMPAHSGGLTDPGAWQNPPVPEHWHSYIRNTMPAFRKDLTPTRGMGIIAETFRKMDGAMRSDHPQVSFCAAGPAAALLTGGHSLEYGLGERSPLARLYDLDGYILLLGVGHENNTSLHLAEHRAQYRGRQLATNGAPVVEGGRRQWKTFPDLVISSDDFGEIGEAFDRAGHSVSGKTGRGTSTFMRSRELVDFGVEYLPQIRGRT